MELPFCPYGADSHRFASVGLNSLLYKTEKDLEQISTLLGHANDAREWANKAGRRRDNIITFSGMNAAAKCFSTTISRPAPIDV